MRGTVAGPARGLRGISARVKSIPHSGNYLTRAAPREPAAYDDFLSPSESNAHHATQPAQRPDTLHHTCHYIRPERGRLDRC
jgi:hypothetical protein